MGGSTGTRVLSHQLSNGLYVSGLPDQYRDRQPTMTAMAMPYTGGDIKSSGEFGKMFDISVEALKQKSPGSISESTPEAGSSRQPSSNSCPLTCSKLPKSPSKTSGHLKSVGIPLHTPNKPGTKKSITGTLPGPAVTGTPEHSHSGRLSRTVDQAFNSNRGVTGKVETSVPLCSGGAPSVVRQNSALLQSSLPATGLITSDPVPCGSPSLFGAPKISSGPMQNVRPSNGLAVQNQPVNNLSNQEHSLRCKLSKVILSTVISFFVIGFFAGGFVLGAAHNTFVLIVVACLLAALMLLLAWNAFWGRNVVTLFVSSYPAVGLADAENGQYVKVTGVVTCGNNPLQSSFQKMNRCVYTSTGLYEYRGFRARPASSKHRTFTWGLRYLERQIVDFYISDFQSGLRALVKAGYGSPVIPYVEERTIVDVTKKNRHLPSDFLCWLSARNLSSDDRVMRLKEGYVKEGSIVTVMGVVQKNENMLMISTPAEPVSTGCQVGVMLPAILKGIILKYDDKINADVISV